jgi:hypothetical protein
MTKRDWASTATSSSAGEMGAGFQWLASAYGPIVGGEKLTRLLGYPSNEAFRQALNRGQLPVETFNIPHRRGKFAYTEDIAAWLSSLKFRGQ